MPNHEVASIKSTIKAFVPSSYLIVRGKDEQITCRLQYANKIICPILRVKGDLIPFSHIIIYG